MYHQTALPLQKSAPKPHRVLVVGGCYAGLAAATNLLDLCEGRAPRFTPGSEATRQQLPVKITIIDERNGFYHVIGSPLALASSEYSHKAWTRFCDVPALQHPAINMVHGSVTQVDLDNRTATVAPNDSSDLVQHEYDYLIAASGLRRVWPVVPQQVARENYLKEAESHINAVRAAKHGVVVIGGGAVGIEMAAELKAVEPTTRVTLIHSRDRLLSSEPLPDDFKDETLSLLRSVGVEVITGKRVQSEAVNETDKTTIIKLSDGSTLAASHVINAISRSSPTTTYLPPSVLDGEGYVKIKPSLQFHDEHHFAAGDIALWSGIKRCGAAMHMGSYCAHNIHQHILSITPSSPRPSSPIMRRVSDSFNDIASSYTPQYKELTEHPAVIGIAIGTTAAAYSPTEGIKSGAEVLKYMFGDDLGFSICYNYMQLGRAPPSTVEPTSATPIDLETTDEVPPGTEQNEQTTPTLSTTSTSSEAGVEPQTPIDAVGNAEVTNFEALQKSPSNPDDVDIAGIVEEIRRSSISTSGPRPEKIFKQSAFKRSTEAV
ncbi:hypothetical protein OHC33_001758 [Knufia fluminis]|uniref:FAD/NAD(P)-binding domain-containing protein n=1 Tax=Knufia fluminis TaxID=191047 RepID=A0AAN8EJZ1_9EURO|nr:hypothetical protein OHC33_001758 [Knufia fluminis]